jgi:hypothetical protein
VGRRAESRWYQMTTQPSVSGLSHTARPPQGLARLRLERRGLERAAILGIVTLQFVVLLAYLSMPIATRAIDRADPWTYYFWAQRIVDGQVPYRDFRVEYPPLALVPMMLPYLSAVGASLNGDTYEWLLRLENALFSSVVALALVRGASHWRPVRRAIPLLGVYALGVTLIAPLLLQRFDIFPALLTLLALLCVLAGRPGWAGLWTGLAIATKLYPVMLLPIFGAYYSVGRQSRPLGRLLLGSAGALTLSLLPVLLVAPGGWLSFLQYHKVRGLQIESLPAGVILLGQLAGLTTVGVRREFGAVHLASPLASLAVGLQPIVFTLAFAALLVVCVSRFQDERFKNGAIGHQTLVDCLVAALLVFIATNKVFSPQFMLWVLPFAPLLRPRHAATLLAAVFLTVLIYPFNYQGLLDLQVLPVLLLNLRNILVVVLILWLLSARVPALTGFAFPRSLRKGFPAVRQRLAAHLPFLVGVGITAILVGLPLFELKAMSGHDAWFHLPRTVELYQALTAGQLFPRWAPDLGSGYGEPLFNYYPPLFYYVAACLHAVGFGFVASENLACFVLVLVAGVAMYCLSGEVFGG